MTAGSLVTFDYKHAYKLPKYVNRPEEDTEYEVKDICICPCGCELTVLRLCEISFGFVPRTGIEIRLPIEFFKEVQTHEEWVGIFLEIEAAL
ncbi:MAG TPA: hypothetical protein VD794_08970 [Flavisolibacter sp.]|nr:hypothetical protein [Flavisolibacter sp.]